jgi:hypothetical protein
MSNVNNSNITFTGSCSFTKPVSLTATSGLTVPSGAVTVTEVGHLRGVTSAIQSQLNTRVTTNTNQTITASKTYALAPSFPAGILTNTSTISVNQLNFLRNITSDVQSQFASNLADINTTRQSVTSLQSSVNRLDQKDAEFTNSISLLQQRDDVLSSVQQSLSNQVSSLQAFQTTAVTLAGTQEITGTKTFGSATFSNAPLVNSGIRTPALTITNQQLERLVNVPANTSQFITDLQTSQATLQTNLEQSILTTRDESMSRDQDLSDNIMALANQSSSLEASIRATNANASALSGRVDQQVTRVDTLSSRQDTLRMDHDALNERHNALKTDHDALRVESKQLETNQQHVSSQVNLLQTSLGTQVSLLGSLENRHQALSESHTILTSRHDTLTTRHESLVTQANQLDTRLSNQIATVDQRLTAQIDQVDGKIRDHVTNTDRAQQALQASISGLQQADRDLATLVSSQVADAAATLQQRIQNVADQAEQQDTLQRSQIASVSTSLGTLQQRLSQTDETVNQKVALSGSQRIQGTKSFANETVFDDFVVVNQGLRTPGTVLTAVQLSYLSNVPPNTNNAILALHDDVQSLRLVYDSDLLLQQQRFANVQLDLQGKVSLLGPQDIGGSKSFKDACRFQDGVTIQKRIELPMGILDEPKMRALFNLPPNTLDSISNLQQRDDLQAANLQTVLDRVSAIQTDLVNRVSVAGDQTISGRKSFNETVEFLDPPLFNEGFQTPSFTLTNTHLAAIQFLPANTIGALTTMEDNMQQLNLHFSNQNSLLVSQINDIKVILMSLGGPPNNAILTKLDILALPSGGSVANTAPLQPWNFIDIRGNDPSSPWVHLGTNLQSRYAPSILLRSGDLSAGQILYAGAELAIEGASNVRQGSIKMRTGQEICTVWDQRGVTFQVPALFLQTIRLNNVEFLQVPRFNNGAVFEQQTRFTGPVIFDQQPRFNAAIDFQAAPTFTAGATFVGATTFKTVTFSSAPTFEAGALFRDIVPNFQSGALFGNITSIRGPAGRPAAVPVYFLNVQGQDSRLVQADQNNLIAPSIQLQSSDCLIVNERSFGSRIVLEGGTSQAGAIQHGAIRLSTGNVERFTITGTGDTIIRRNVQISGTLTVQRGITAGTVETRAVSNVWSWRPRDNVRELQLFNGAVPDQQTPVLTIQRNGTIVVASDERLKQDIQHLHPKTSLEKLLSIGTYMYRFQDEELDSPRSTGFLAQEIQQAFPDSVRTEQQNGQDVLKVCYQDLFVHAIGAIQHLYQLIRGHAAPLDPLPLDPCP